MLQALYINQQRDLLMILGKNNQTHSEVGRNKYLKLFNYITFLLIEYPDQIQFQSLLLRLQRQDVLHRSTI